MYTHTVVYLYNWRSHRPFPSIAFLPFCIIYHHVMCIPPLLSLAQPIFFAKMIIRNLH